MLDGRVLGASQVEYKPFGKPPLKREPQALRGIVLELRRYRSGYRFHLSTNQHMLVLKTILKTIPKRSPQLWLSPCAGGG